MFGRHQKQPGRLATDPSWQPGQADTKHPQRSRQSTPATTGRAGWRPPAEQADRDRLTQRAGSPGNPGRPDAPQTDTHLKDEDSTRFHRRTTIAKRTNTPGERGCQGSGGVFVLPPRCRQPRTEGAPGGGGVFVLSRPRTASGAGRGWGFCSFPPPDSGANQRVLGGGVAMVFAPPPKTRWNARFT